MKNGNTVFVLWADQFDEAAAVTLLVRLRQASLNVKLISLSHAPAAGAHGLVLMADMTMEQALPLAHRASCVIIPTNGAGLGPFGNDPRVAQLLRRACDSNSLLVVGATALGQVNGLLETPWPAPSLMALPEAQELPAFARHLTRTALMLDASKPPVLRDREANPEPIIA